MKIAVFHELPNGGARRVVNDFGKKLKKKNRIDLYIVDSQKRREEEKFFTKIYYYKFISPKWSGGNWRIRLYKDTLELWKLYKLHKEIAKKINKGKYDIVIAHPSLFTQAPFILRFLFLPRVYYAHEAYRIIYEPYFKHNYFLGIYRGLYESSSRYFKKVVDVINIKNADYIIVNSKNTKKNISTFYSKKSTVCYPGVDVDFFSPSKITKDIDVLFIGSLDDNTDGFYDLKDALLNMQKIKLEIVGDGKKWLTNKELRNFYRRSKIVFCGAYNEPLGLVPLEAAACGVPVIAVNEGGYKETVIDGKTGYLVKRDSREIKGVIERLLKNKNMLNKISQNTRENVVKNWSISKLSRKFEEELEKIITRH